MMTKNARYPTNSVDKFVYLYVFCGPFQSNAYASHRIYAHIYIVHLVLESIQENSNVIGSAIKQLTYKPDPIQSQTCLYSAIARTSRSFITIFEPLGFIGVIFSLCP